MPTAIDLFEKARTHDRVELLAYARENDLEKLEQMLERAEGDGGGVLVIVDGVFSMEGDLPDLPRVAELTSGHAARLMVDEAHGVGVLGERGTGASEAFGVEDRVDL